MVFSVLLGPPYGRAVKLPGVEDVERAAVRLKEIAEPTPLQRSPRLSALTGYDVWIKREDLHEVRSYKGRGAYTVIASLTDEERARGVTCASAGNHAQGVAFACARTGVRARIFLPRTTPRQKRQRIAALGGDWVEVVIDGDTYDDAALASATWAEESGATPVPPFDDPRTIAGQGTVAAEVLQQLGTAPDAIIVPVGGGGLLAGMLVVLAEHAPGARGRRCRAGRRGVDGGRGRRGWPDRAGHGRLVRRRRRRTPGRDVDVRGGPGARAGPDRRPRGSDLRGDARPLPVRRHHRRARRRALATAALAAGPRPPRRLDRGVRAVRRQQRHQPVRRDLGRALVHEGLKHYFLVEFPQEPGALRRFLDEVLGPDDDVVLFEYVKRSNRETGPALVGIELQDRDDFQPLLDRMAVSPLRVEVVSPDSPLFRFVQ